MTKQIFCGHCGVSVTVKSYAFTEFSVNFSDSDILIKVFESQSDAVGFAKDFIAKVDSSLK
jgi:hypothetical protein